MQIDQKAQFSSKQFIFINRIFNKVFVLPFEEDPKIMYARPFVRHYQKTFVTFGQMVLLVVFINAILKLDSNLMRNTPSVRLYPKNLDTFGQMALLGFSSTQS